MSGDLHSPRLEQPRHTFSVLLLRSRGLWLSCWWPLQSSFDDSSSLWPVKAGKTAERGLQPLFSAQTELSHPASDFTAVCKLSSPRAPSAYILLWHLDVTAWRASQIQSDPKRSLNFSQSIFYTPFVAIPIHPITPSENLGIIPHTWFLHFPNLHTPNLLVSPVSCHSERHPTSPALSPGLVQQLPNSVSRTCCCPHPACAVVALCADRARYTSRWSLCCCNGTVADKATLHCLCSGHQSRLCSALLPDQSAPATGQKESVKNRPSLHTAQLNSGQTWADIL